MNDALQCKIGQTIPLMNKIRILKKCCIQGMILLRCLASRGPYQPYAAPNHPALPKNNVFVSDTLLWKFAEPTQDSHHNLHVQNMDILVLYIRTLYEML